MSRRWTSYGDRLRTRWTSPAVLLLAVLAFGLSQDSLYRIQLGTLAGIYAVATIGLTILFGAAGQISLGQAGFLGIAAFATAYLTVQRGMPLLLACIAGVAASTAVGLLIGWSALRITGHYLALVTLAFGLTFTEVGRTLLPDGWYGVPTLALAGLDLSDPTRFFLFVWLVVLCCLVGADLMVTSRFGRAISALRDDPLAAASCGVNLARSKIAVFGVASALGGVSGTLFAVYQGSVTETSFSFILSVNLLIMVVLGGLGSPGGAVAGSVFLVLVPELGRRYEDYRLLGYGLVLIAVLALLPGGLASVGSRLVRRERAPAPAGIGDATDAAAREAEAGRT